MRRLLPFLLATLAVTVAAFAANLLVLDRAGASGNEIGNLSPVQPALTAPPAVSPPAATSTPSSSSTTAHDRQQHDGEHHGRDHAGNDD